MRKHTHLLEHTRADPHVGEEKGGNGLSVELVPFFLLLFDFFLVVFEHFSRLSSPFFRFDIAGENDVVARSLVMPAAYIAVEMRVAVDTIVQVVVRDGQDFTLLLLVSCGKLSAQPEVAW